MRPQRVRMRDVAIAAGVSQTTASFALSGRDTSTIPLKTQEHVRKVAREMGYQPNLVARSLVRQRTDTIGLMISVLENPFFVNVLKCAEDLVFKSGYQVLLDANSQGYGQYQPLHRISGWMVDGVLMWTAPFYDLAKYLGEQAKTMPVVYLGHLREDNTDAVAMDLYGAGKLAMEYLLEKGHRRISYISTFPTEYMFWRNSQIHAFHDVARQAGIEPQVIVLGDEESLRSAGFRAGVAIAARPKAERPDALICQNDWTAMFVYLGLLQGGLRVPDDIAMVGFDGIEEAKYLPGGPLTTVRMPIETLCRSALDILLKRIEGKEDMSPQQILVPTELVPGGTA